jgi:integrase/recombinase XerD
MTLQHVVEEYATFRKMLGERFRVNGQVLKAFCQAMGHGIAPADVAPERVSSFLMGVGPLTASWHVKHNALVGFYRYAISRGFVAHSPLPLVVPKRPPAFQPYIYSPAELRHLIDATDSYQRNRGLLEPSAVKTILLLMYAAALRTSEVLSLTVADVDLSNALLIVRESKFFKSRLVPIGPKTNSGALRLCEGASGICSFPRGRLSLLCGEKRQEDKHGHVPRRLPKVARSCSVASSWWTALPTSSP